MENEKVIDAEPIKTDQEVIPKKVAALEILKKIKIIKISSIITIGSMFLVMIMAQYGTMAGSIFIGIMAIVYTLVVWSNLKQEKYLKQKYNL